MTTTTAIINKTIPPSHGEIHKYDRCHYYQFRNNTRDMMNFVCDDAIKTSQARVIFYGGVLVGDVVFGILANKMIPESSRWLLRQGKYDDAENIIQKIAKVNKKKIPARIIDEKTLETPETANMYHLFSTLEMTKRTIILLWNWIVITMVYYGVTTHTGGTLGGNVYLNFFILAIVEVPAVLI
ncbi:Hypothetical predicted protein, partial [Mytilus galloprovincialis]